MQEKKRVNLIKLVTNLCAGSIIVIGLASYSSAQAQTASSASQAGQVKPPSNFAFPIYPGATKIHWEPYDSALSIPRYHVSFCSPEPKEKLVQFYTAKVKELGWELQCDIATYGNMTLITANKAGVNASLQIKKAEQGNGSTCAIITSKRNQ